MNASLLSEIDAFLRETGMSEYRFGFLAVRNGRLVERLRAQTTARGRPARVWPDTEDRIREFIATERKLRRSAA